LLALVNGSGPLRALAASFRLGWLRGKLIEINLVLAIIKLALIVLLMVFCATPLPFESVVSGQPLFDWWLLGLALYCIVSDFFHVVRAVAYVELWRIWKTHARSLSAA
jgi:hypothetical protein